MGKHILVCECGKKHDVSEMFGEFVSDFFKLKDQECKKDELLNSQQDTAKKVGDDNLSLSMPVDTNIEDEIKQELHKEYNAREHESYYP